MIRITKTGFAADDLAGWQQLSFAEFVAASLSVTARARTVVHLPNTTQIDDVSAHISDMAAIAIEFPAVTDGRGFSLSRLIREAGFAGRLRAVGLLLRTSSVICSKPDLMNIWHRIKQLSAFLNLFGLTSWSLFRSAIRTDCQMVQLSIRKNQP